MGSVGALRMSSVSCTWNVCAGGTGSVVCCTWNVGASGTGGVVCCASGGMVLVL